jgi:hypothetical protein
MGQVNWALAQFRGLPPFLAYSPNSLKMERETGFEPATSSLGSWHSTTELLPRSSGEAGRAASLTSYSTGGAGAARTQERWRRYKGGVGGARHNGCSGSSGRSSRGESSPRRIFGRTGDFAGDAHAGTRASSEPLPDGSCLGPGAGRLYLGRSVRPRGVGSARPMCSAAEINARLLSGELVSGLVAPVAEGAVQLCRRHHTLDILRYGAHELSHPPASIA